MSDLRIGVWAKRTGQKWHLVDSTVAGDIVTRCGRRLADKPDAPFQVSAVMPLTRMIGQPQLCKQCDRAPLPEDDGSTAPDDE